VASDSRALTLKLLADTADFQKKLQEGSKDVDSFGEKAAAFGKKVAAALAVATAAIGAFAVAAVQSVLLMINYDQHLADWFAALKMSKKLRIY